MAETPQEREARLIREGLERGEAMKRGAVGAGAGPSITDYASPEKESPTQRWFVGYEWSPYSSTPRKQYASTESGAVDQFYTFDENQLARLNAARSLEAGYKVPDTWNKSTWENAVKKAKADSRRYGTEISPWEYIDPLADQWRDVGKGGGKKGKYTGPVSTVTKMAEPDMRMMADAIASTVLGRAVTEDEYKRAAERVRNLEVQNPAVSGAGVASQTNISAVSSEARKDVMTKALLQEQGAEDFTLATKMMGLYRKALEEMPNG